MMFTRARFLSIPILLLLATSAFAQRTPRWEIVDSLAMDLAGYASRFIAGEDPRSIVVIGNETAIDDERASLSAGLVVRQTTDNGRSWKRLHFGAIHDQWRDLAHPTRDMIVIVGDSMQRMDPFSSDARYHGMFLVSRDGGRSWSRTDLDSNSIVSNVSMSDATSGIMRYSRIGNRYNRAPDTLPDLILHTRDAWRTWTQVSLPSNVDAFYTIEALTRDRWIIVTQAANPERRQIYRTTDAGVTWSESADTPEGIYDLSFVDSLNGWGTASLSGATTLRNTISRTTDGGNTWTTQYDQTVDGGLFRVGRVSFGDLSNGLVVQRDRFLRTTDGGTTWTSEYFPGSLDSGSTFIWGVLMPTGDQAYGVMRVSHSYNPNGIAAVIRHTAGETMLLRPFFIRPDLRVRTDTADVLVEWTPIIGADRYRVQIVGRSLDTSNTLDLSAFDRPEIDTTLSATTLLLSRLKYNHGYYARVMALSANGEESEWFRATYLFVTRKTPLTLLAPRILKPQSGAEGVDLPARITWSGVTDALEYDLQISEQSDFSSPVVDRSRLTDLAVTVEELSTNRVYYARVRAHNGQVASQWSDADRPHSFNTIVNTAIVDRSGPYLFDATIRAFPNPTTRSVTVEIAGFQHRPGARLTLHNAAGRELRSIEVDADRFDLDVTALPAGIYRLSLSENNRSATTSLVILR